MTKYFIMSCCPVGQVNSGPLSAMSETAHVKLIIPTRRKILTTHLQLRRFRKQCRLDARSHNPEKPKTQTRSPGFCDAVEPP
jgi:hypothetical protein